MDVSSFLTKISQEIGRLEKIKNSQTAKLKIKVLKDLSDEINFPSNKEKPLEAILLAWKQESEDDYNILCKKRNPYDAGKPESQRLIDDVIKSQEARSHHHQLPSVSLKEISQGYEPDPILDMFIHNITIPPEEYLGAPSPRRSSHPSNSSAVELPSQKPNPFNSLFSFFKSKSPRPLPPNVHREIIDDGAGLKPQGKKVR